MADERPVHNALIFSDLHLGWSVCRRAHERLLSRLAEAVDDAELIVMNGDIVDHIRRPRRSEELVQRLEALVARWRSEGRQVVYVEGNHDPMGGGLSGLSPDRWSFDFQGSAGERVRVLHGHRFGPVAYVAGLYERLGQHLLVAENRLYDWRLLQKAYRLGPGWLVGAVGMMEDRAWRPKFPGRVSELLSGIDVLVHGHFHFGPGQGRIGRVTTWRSGAWASWGHFGSVDRMLRYRKGRFERIALVGERWQTTADGR